MSDIVGYTQNISPEKYSRDGHKKFINFNVQTGKKSYRQAVCFDMSLAPSLKQYQTDHMPVKIRNCTLSGEHYTS